jgi:hypothetical protein
MVMGFRQRDPSGNLLVDITTRMPRIMGRVAISPGVSGSVSVPASGTNPLFYWFNASAAQPDFNASPKFTDNGTVISWTFGAANAAYNRGGSLVYGRY